MGKGKPNENYYVQQDDEWIPIDLRGGNGGRKGNKLARSSRDSEEEYHVRRDGEWVKVSGVQSVADVIAKMKISNAQESVAAPVMAATVLQAPANQYQGPILMAPAQQGPLQYHEYIITVKPPSAAAQEPVELLPGPANPRRIPRQPLRAVPNEYADGLIVPQRAPVYREPPRPAPGRRRHPGPRYDSPRRNYSPPPMPMPEPPVVQIDAYEMGKEAYYREAAGAVDYVDDSCDCDDGVGARTSPAPGYYLAGYLYYGDPSQPAPKLEPVGAAAACPPGHYLAGYTTGGS